MAERKRRYRAEVKRAANAASFLKDGHVMLDAPQRDARLTEEAIRGVNFKFMSDFAHPNRVDKGRKMYAFELSYNALGMPDNEEVERLIARYLDDCFDRFCEHVGMAVGLHSLDRPSVLWTLREPRTVQRLHLDFADIPPLQLDKHQFSVLVPIGANGAQLEICPTAWAFIRQKQRDGVVGDVIGVVDELNETLTGREEREFLSIKPGSFLVFAQHFPHAGSLAAGEANHRAHGYFCTRNRRAPVDSVVLISE